MANKLVFALCLVSVAYLVSALPTDEQQVEALSVEQGKPAALPLKTTRALGEAQKDQTKTKTMEKFGFSGMGATGNFVLTSSGFERRRLGEGEGEGDAEPQWESPAQCLSDPCSTSCSTSCITLHTTGRIAYDLGESGKVVKGVQIWKHLQSGSNGLKGFDVETSTDGESWTVVQSFESERVPSGPDAAPGKQEQFHVDCVTRYIAINVKSNYGAGYTSVGAIKFHVSSNSCPAGTPRASQQKFAYTSLTHDAAEAPERDANDCTPDLSNCYPIKAINGQLGSCTSCQDHASGIEELNQNRCDGNYWAHKLFKADPTSGCGACPAGQQPIKSSPDGSYHCVDNTHSIMSEYCTPDGSHSFLPHKSDVCQGAKVPRICVYRNEVESSQFYDFGVGYNDLPDSQKTGLYNGLWAIKCKMWKKVSCQQGANPSESSCASALRSSFISAQCRAGSVESGKCIDPSGEEWVVNGDYVEDQTKLPVALQQYDLEYGLCSSLAQSFG